MPTNKMIGVDLGFRSTGLVAAVPTRAEPGYTIDEVLCVKTEKANKKLGLFVAQDDVSQCQALFRDVMAFFDRHNPTAAVAELPTAGAKGARANRGMGIATGMIGAVAESLGIPFVWVVPEESKKVVCGKRNASKDEMMSTVTAMFPHVEWPKAKNRLEHVADAAAALLVGRTSNMYKLILERIDE